MKNLLKNFGIIVAGVLLGPIAALAVQITVPSAPGAGYMLTSTTTGAYIATSTNPLYLGYIVATSTATSTYSSAVQARCFTVDGVTCISSSAATNYWTSAGQALYNNTGTSVGVNLTNPGSAFEVKGTTTDATASAVDVWNSASTNLFHIGNNGLVGIGTTTPTASLAIANASASPYLSITNGTGSLTRLAVDATGNVLIGSNANINLVGITPGFNIIGTGSTVAQGQTRFSSSAAGSPRYIFAKSDGTTVGDYTAIQAADEILGTIQWTGSDGVAFTNNAAEIIGRSSQAFDTTHVGGYLTFNTTNNSTTLNEAARITAQGNLIVGSNSTQIGAVDTGYGSIITGFATTTDVLSSTFVAQSIRGAIVSGNLIGNISFRSNDSNLTAPGVVVAGVQALASGTHTAATVPTDLLFNTSAAGGLATSSEKMRILGSGFVGINTGGGNNAPSTFLVVAGAALTNSTSTDQLYLRSQLNTNISTGSEVGGIGFQAYDDNATTPGVVTARIVALAEGGHSAASAPTGLAFYTNNGDARATGSVAERLRITATGLVGIGTSTPFANLSVAGAAGQLTPVFAISTSTSGFATSTAFLIDANGNVGIGTTTPWGALSVKNNSGINQLVLAYDDTNYAQFNVTNTGLLSITSSANNGIAFSTVGTRRFVVSGNTFISNVTGGPQLSNLASSATVPVLIPNRSDTTTGIGADASGNIALITSATTKVELLNNGNFGIGSTTPGSLFSIGGTGTGWNFYDNATTTKNGVGGINITQGCFAVGGTCLSVGGSGVTSIATNNGLTGGTITTTGTIGLAAIAANSVLGNITGASAVPVAVATSSLFMGTIGQVDYFGGTGALMGTSTLTIGTNSHVGVGTTTPWARFAVVGDGGTAPLFSAGTSTNALPNFTIDQWGHVIYGGDKPTTDGRSTFVAGGDNWFRVIMGSVQTFSVITFAHAWDFAPGCLVNEDGALTSVLPTATTTASTVRITFPSAVSSVTVDVTCGGLRP